MIKDNSGCWSDKMLLLSLLTKGLAASEWSSVYA